MSGAALKLKPSTVDLEVSLQGRDRLQLQMNLVNGTIESAKLSGSGCSDFLNLLQAWRPKLTGSLETLELPQGDSHSSLLLREAILRAQGEWKFPYADEEICHCRAVSTAKVDAAIIGGCRSVRAIARETSAGTSCGSCRTDTEAIINYRLKS